MDAECLTRFAGICFEPASQNGLNEVFGVADFLATVAIFVVAYSLSDAKYKFRSSATSVSYRTVLFLATAFGGALLLISNIVFALHLHVPRFLNNPFYFQIAIAALFIAVISYWMYRAFVRPPVFTRSNAIPFARQVFRGIADGDQAELSACVYEVGRSARELVSEASRTESRRSLIAGGFEEYIPQGSQVASEILLLIGDRRFCKLVAKRMPWVAAEIFRAAGETQRNVRQLAQFSRNVSDEFFADPETAIHHEDDFYYSGLIGHLKPVSSAMFGNSKLIGRLAAAGGSPLHLLWLRHREWTLPSWKTYNKAVLIYFEDRLRCGVDTNVSTDLYQVFSGYRSVCNDLRVVNEMSDGDYYRSLPYGKFQEVVNFVLDGLSLLEKYNVIADRFPPKHNERFLPDDVYDHFVSISIDLFSSAGAVDTSDFRNWEIQHNTLWSKLMAEADSDVALAIFRKRLQRVIWWRVKDLSRLPDFQSARILAVCLNVLGFRMDHNVHRPVRTRAIKRLVVGWTKRNFLTIHSKYPTVAGACIGGTITFDEKNKRLVKTYSAYFDKEPAREYLDLDLPEEDTDTITSSVRRP